MMRQQVKTSEQELTISKVVVGLAIVGIICILSIVILSFAERLKPEVLAALAGIAGTCIGSLATMLTTFTPASIPGGRRSTDPPT